MASATAASSLTALRRDLRQANLEGMAKRNVDDPFDHLDGSLKRNTALIKKLRSINQENCGGIIDEMTQVRQSRFLGEAIQALSENRPKTSADLMAVMRVCSLLVQRYHGAEWMLVSRLTAIAKEADVSGDLVTVRAMLRWVVECLIVGILRDPKSLHELLKGLLPEDDLRGPGHVSIATAFAKHYYALLLAGSSDADGEPLLDALGTEWKERIAALLVSYFRSMCRLLVRLHGKSRSLQSRSKSIYENIGDLNQRQATALQQAMASVEQLQTALTDLAGLLDLPMPTLEQEPEMQPSLSEGGKIVFTEHASKAGAGGLGSPLIDSRIWDSEEDRSFYEDFIRLAERVPSALLEKVPESVDAAIDDAATAEPSQNGANGPSEDNSDEYEAKFDSSRQLDPEVASKLPHLPSSSSEEEPAPTGTKAPLTVATFIASLSNIHSAALVDQACLDFCFLNSRSLRKNLSEYLIELPRNRIDLIPFIGRFLATIKPHFPAIPGAVCESITGQFHFLWKNKSLPLAGTRSRVCRYIGELTKFRVLPQGMAFTCLKKAIDDFSLHNVEMVSLLLETCGRFLYHQAESHRRVEILMEVVGRKKRQAPLSESQFLQITNALASVNPSQVTTVLLHGKRRTPLEAYILNLVRTELTAETAEWCFRQLRKLDWQDPLTRDTLKRAFLKVWKVRFGVISLLAAMVDSLKRYHADWVVELVDDLIGEIRLDLDHNKPVWQQQRIAMIKYLGSLYVYNVVDADVVFAVLAMLLTYGHPGGIPRRSSTFPLVIDPPADHFRIRLCTVLLQTISEYVTVGPLVPVLEQYLCLLQYYIECKEGPLSVDLEYLVEDLFEQLGRPWTWRGDYEGALAALESITGLAIGSNRLLSLPGSEAEQRLAEAKAEAERREQQRLEQQRIEASFEADLTGMISESLAQRKLERKAPAFDAVVPLATKVAPASTATESSSITSLRLLTRRRNRLQAHQIDLLQDQSTAANPNHLEDQTPPTSSLLSDIQAIKEQKRLESMDIASRTLRLTLQNEGNVGDDLGSILADGRNSRGRVPAGRGGDARRRPGGRGRGGAWRGGWSTYSP